MRFQFLLVTIFGFHFFQSQAQQTAVVDFTTADAQIAIHPYTQKVDGTVTYTVDVLAKTDSIFLDAQQMRFSEISWNGKRIKFSNDEKHLILYKKFKPKAGNKLRFTYEATPKKAMYFFGWKEGGRKQVYTQGQGKYSSNWLPSFDDVNEKVIFNLDVEFPKDYTVIANGSLTNTKVLDSTSIWSYSMQKPMSSYLLAVAAGNYEKKMLTAASGTPLELYYYPEQPERVEPTYRYTKEIFDFFEKEIGVKFPWQNYKQIPVRDFMYGGMENTTATIFNDGYFIDSLSFIDKNYVNVNAHELAHQWFGDLVTEKNPEDHWLQEGFATFYALLAEKEVFGEAYCKASLFDIAQQLFAVSEKGSGESLLNPKASSLTFYQKGAWALVALQEELGAEVFQKGIQLYLQKYQFTNVTTDDFLSVMEKISGTSLTDFKQSWLVSTEFPYEEAMELLADEPYGLPELMKVYFKNSTVASSEKSKTIWKQLPEVYQEKLVAYQYNSFTDSTYINAILDGDAIKVRQQYLVQTQQIPTHLQDCFEAFLKDPSYNTQENMLYKLWMNFPKSRNQYFETTKNAIGFSDRNLRMLWLTLTLVTPNYKQQQKQRYFEELTSYTNPKYGFDVRENAFSFIKELDAFTDDNLKDLVQACQHPAWRFANFSRNLLDQLLQDDPYKMRLQTLLPQLNTKEKEFLQKKL